MWHQLMKQLPTLNKQSSLPGLHASHRSNESMNVQIKLTVT